MCGHRASGCVPDSDHHKRRARAVLICQKTVVCAYEGFLVTTRDHQRHGVQALASSRCSLHGHIAHALESACPDAWKQLLEAEEQAALATLSKTLERFALALGDSGHFFSNREMHPLAQRALREEVKGAALARGLRKIVDLFESFSPTASILGSLSLRALTDQSPADETVVTAAREQAKASASKVAIAAAVRALPWVNFATIGIGIDPARTPLLLPTVPSLGGGSIRSGRV